MIVLTPKTVICVYNRREKNALFANVWVILFQSTVRFECCV